MEEISDLQVLKFIIPNAWKNLQIKRKKKLRRKESQRLNLQKNNWKWSIANKIGHSKKLRYSINKQWEIIGRKRWLNAQTVEESFLLNHF